MTINEIEVQSEEHLEELIAELDEGSKEGLRMLFKEEQSLNS